MRKSQAAPRDRRIASNSLGNICGSTTYHRVSQVPAPRVCALISCSRGNSRTRPSSSRAIKGATPMAMSMTFASSPTPKAMSRIGRMARGGTMATMASRGDRLAPARGIRPEATPSTRAVRAPSPTPSANRWRLTPVSSQNSKSPERRSGSVAMRSSVSPMVEKAGRSRSCGFSASRASEKAR